MGSPRSNARVRASVAAGLLVLVGGCTLAPARVWNLDQLHEPDGTPRGRARLMNDLEYVLTRLFEKTHYGGAAFREQQAEGKRIKNPLGECFDNVVGLADAKRDEQVAGLQAWAYGWLAVDCTYVLSRERCAFELGGLARDLRVPASAPPPEGEAVTPEGVKTALDELLAAVRGVVAAPALAGTSLVDACARVRALPLDRAGALRLLRATNELLTNDRDLPELAPLRELRLALAQRCVVLALRKALADPNGRVRAAALDSALIAFPSERDALLHAAITDAMENVEAPEEVVQRALELLAEHGLPQAPAGTESAVFERGWEDLLLQVVRISPEGPVNAAACRALGKVTAAPGSLRPEVWLAWARARPPAPTPPQPAAPDTAPSQTPPADPSAPAEAPHGAGASP